MNFIEQQQRRIAYCTAGNPEHPLLIMAHPLGMDHSVWDAMRQTLANDFYVVQYDLPGHGQSGSVSITSPITLYDLGNDVLALVQSLGKQAFHFVGTSIGGLIGIELITRLSQTSNTSKCILVSATLTNTAAKIGTADSWQTRANRVRTAGLSEIACEIIPRWFSEAFQAHEAEQLVDWLHTLSQTDNESYAQLCDVLGHSDFTPHLGALPENIQQRILLIAGSEDIAMPLAHMQALAHLLPQAHFKTMACGHVPSLEQPYIFLTLLTQHLTAEK